MRIVLFGTGNLAVRLGIALRSGNHEIVQVCGRNDSSASALAARLGCGYTISKCDITPDAEILLLAVSDRAIAEVLKGVEVKDRLVVHTAGSVPMEVLSGFSANIGVLYPLQTLSEGREVDFRQVPLFLEASNTVSMEKLKILANSVSGVVREADSETRRDLHLAAVFACNFVNHLYNIAGKILEEKELGFDLLKPLIRETAQKAEQMSPGASQTGPAIRNDEGIMKLHLEMLENHPGWKELYRLISRDINHTNN